MDLRQLVDAANSGNREAWDAIVDRMENMVWSVVRSFRLSDADSNDAAQMVWLRVVENLTKVNDPERLGLWIATTARRECMRLIERQGRTVATDPTVGFDRMPAGEDVAERQTDRMEAERIVAALGQVEPDCQRLLRMVLCDPPMSYAEISAALGIAVGTIGARRQRCLRSLRAMSRR